MSHEPLGSSTAGKILKSRKFIIIFVSLAALFCPVAALAIQIKDTQEPYLSLTILNNEGKIGNYFANATITEQDMVSWYVDVQNGMGKTEYVAVKIKLLNSTQLMPDDLTNSPSPERELVEFRQALTPYSNWQLPLNWTVSSIEKQEGNVVAINTMTINNQIIDNLNIQSVEGKDFTIVIELWKYDNVVSDFTFAWSASDETRSVWNQIWFDVEI